MRRATLQALRQQYAFRCGYCGISESEVGAELTVDHYQPRSQAGADDLENLVYCCHACNEFKGDRWGGDARLRILHPLRDDLSQHVHEGEDGALLPITETGAPFTSPPYSLIVPRYYSIDDCNVSAQQKPGRDRRY